MATNQKYDHLDQVSVPVASGKVSNDPTVYGQRPGVCLTDRDEDGEATVAFEGGFELSVEGVDGSGNAAVVAGDILYYTAADDPPINKKTTGVRFGYAHGAVASGATGTILVKVGY